MHFLPSRLSKRNWSYKNNPYCPSSYYFVLSVEHKIRLRQLLFSIQGKLMIYTVQLKGQKTINIVHTIFVGSSRSSEVEPRQNLSCLLSLAFHSTFRCLKTNIIDAKCRCFSCHVTDHKVASLKNVTIPINSDLWPKFMFVSHTKL